MRRAAGGPYVEQVDYYITDRKIDERRFVDDDFDITKIEIGEIDAGVSYPLDRFSDVIRQG
jgi:hypothetical protein